MVCVHATLPSFFLRALSVIQDPSEQGRSGSGGIGAHYVVTAYSKSKWSRWGLALAGQFSARQLTVTETRCGRAGIIVKGWSKRD